MVGNCVHMHIDLWKMENKWWGGSLKEKCTFSCLWTNIFEVSLGGYKKYFPPTVFKDAHHMWTGLMLFFANYCQLGLEQLVDVDLDKSI